jgi:hypothetical protein
MKVAPSAGQGLHDWILAFTRDQLCKGKSEKDTKLRTWEECKSKGRPLSILGKEIDDAIKGAALWIAEHPGANAGASAGAGGMPYGWWLSKPPSQGFRRSPLAGKWHTDIDHGLLNYVLGRVKKLELQSRDYLDIGELYAGINFPVCIAEEVNKPIAKPLKRWQQQQRQRQKTLGQWIVPNPCLKCGEGGGVKNDRNAGERMWLIIEFDQWTLEEQAKLLVWLGRVDHEWELSMIVYSGSKSLHGWFSAVGKCDHKEVIRFFKRACSLGCDRAMRSSVQYTRMPLGINTKTLRMQEIIHFDENAVEKHSTLLLEEYR